MSPFLHLISTKEITLLKELNKHIHINKQGKFSYKNIPSLQFMAIINFINKLEDGEIYTIIPMISMFGKDNDPYIVISKQILLTKHSSPQLIYDFINYKLDIAIQDFGKYLNFHLALVSNLIALFTSFKKFMFSTEVFFSKSKYVR
jgi:hypothetical protein